MAQQMDHGAHAQAQAGPSKPRKPTAPHPSSTSSNTTPRKKRKLPPPLPQRPTASSHPSASIHSKRAAPATRIKTLQGVSKTRSDTTKDGFGREVVFVTRKNRLGALMGRCRSLVVDEGYTSLRLHAIGAAIPQAMLLLYALLDLLPYPVGNKGMWYEIRTGSVECIDEVGATPSLISSSSSGPAGVSKEGDGNGDEQKEGKAREEDEDGDADLAWLQGLAAVQEDTPGRRIRIKSTIQIDLHICPKPKRKRTSDPQHGTDVDADTKASALASLGLTHRTNSNIVETITNKNPVPGRSATKRNRPSKKRRIQLAAARRRSPAPVSTHNGEHGGANEEEEMMNVDESSIGKGSDPINGSGNGNGRSKASTQEEQEEIEDVEE
ncbi:hypothetical protein I316_05571 [Kwoniella heveanensis BCC8398]|uniref:Uncharacterized protein n=1 Tax=Kwoniella heveanensis BCC8398 TaxID=1296120 RepID=A0A1B9GNL8_9TREE|nr:hypothetical protein I316_05571 [Kwoniella heveanensis BCC8398]